MAAALELILNALKTVALLRQNCRWEWCRQVADVVDTRCEVVSDLVVNGFISPLKFEKNRNCSNSYTRRICR